MQLQRLICHGRVTLALFTCWVIFGFTLGLVAPPTVAAQGRFLVYDDVDYFVLKDQNHRFIYPETYRPLVPDIVKYSRLFKDIYEAEYNWRFDDESTLILTSPRNQTPNGFATVWPHLHTVFFVGGPELIDEFSVRSWLYVLLVHETAHLYQLNVKRGYSASLTNIFGRSEITPSSFFPPFAYTQHPNVFLPTFITEGNATFNEARFGNGGRLYNGAIRSLMLQSARAGRINPTVLMNDHLEFPFGREKYWIGGYFFLDLAQRYGAAAANRFFFAHADYKFNPFQIDFPFREVFRRGYSSALADFVERWRPLWSRQVAASGEVLFESQIHSGLTKSDGEIRFLTTTGKKIAQAHVYNVSDRKWTSESVNMPMGRLFRDHESGLVAASTQTVSAKEIRSGLFGDGYSFEKSDLGRQYYDISKSHRVWARTESSLRDLDLYKSTQNGPPQRVGAGSSSALISPTGEAYYFRQVGKTRTLYRDDKALFSFRGYYGFPVEVLKSGVIFVGPAERGSSLFLWRSGEFYRLNESDLIIDAKLVDNKRALVAEITADGYKYKVTELRPKKEAPFEYKYFVENERGHEIFARIADEELEASEDASTPPSSIQELEKPYSSFSHWQFDGIDPYFFIGTSTPIVGSLNFRFSDPLQNHTFSTLLNSGSFGEYGVQFRYNNLKTVFNWDLSASLQHEAEVETDNTTASGYRILDRFDSWQAATGFNYIFHRRPQWQNSLHSHFVYENEDPDIPLADTDKKYTVLTQFKTKHVVSPFLAYSPYRTLDFELAHENVRTAPHWTDERNIYGGALTVSHDIFRQTYLSARYQASYTDSRFPVIEFDDTPDDFLFPSATQVLRNTQFPDQAYFDVRKVSAEIKQGINGRLYFPRFPFSLRRFALIAAYNEYYGSTVRKAAPDTLFHEVGGGLEFEILVAHRFPLRVRAIHYGSSFDNEDNIAISLGLNLADE